VYLAPNGPGLPSRGGPGEEAAPSSPPPPRPEDVVQDCRAEPSLAASPALEEADGLNGGGCGEAVIAEKLPLPGAPVACGVGARESVAFFLIHGAQG